MHYRHVSLNLVVTEKFLQEQIVNSERCYNFFLNIFHYYGTLAKNIRNESCFSLITIVSKYDSLGPLFEYRPACTGLE